MFGFGDSSWRKSLKEGRAIARDLDDPSPQELETLLARGAADSLTLPEANRLFNLMYSPEFPVLKEKVLAASKQARQRVFGNKAVIMAPVEVSNRCSSDCLFCGWRSSNPDIPRTKISPDLVIEQVDYLLDLGIGYIELVGGDDFQFVREELPGLVKSVRQRMAAKGMDGQVCICSMAVTEKHYREWKSHGVDSMFVWQETYSPELYAEKIVAGPKARGITDSWKVRPGRRGYEFRVFSQERARRAGVDVGLGFMLGLNPDINFEFVMTLQHVRRLLREFGADRRRPVILGMPVWNQITTPRTDKRPSQMLDAEAVFPFLSAVLFLALPKGAVWVFPNCRVCMETQMLALEVAGVFTSTEVKLGPGGYLPSLIRRREQKGEDVSALKAKVRAEMGKDCSDLEKVQTELDIGEQFLHHFHPHDAYTAAMRQRGIEIVPFQALAG